MAFGNRNRLRLLRQVLRQMGPFTENISGTVMPGDFRDEFANNAVKTTAIITIISLTISLA